MKIPLKSVALSLWLTLLVVSVVSYGMFIYQRRTQRLQDAVSEKVEQKKLNQKPIIDFQVQPFILTERSGQPFDSRELQGKVWVASFFFTNCPGPCTTLNGTISKLHMHEQFRDIEDLRFVSITVNPEIDKPDVLTRYANNFSADPRRWVFLTGSKDDVRKVVEGSFKSSFNGVTHSKRLALVNREGKVVGYYESDDPKDLTLLKMKIHQLTSDNEEPEGSEESDGSIERSEIRTGTAAKESSPEKDSPKK